jgi:6-phosphogluconate dehydrogenase (decarboxylating)
MVANLLKAGYPIVVFDIDRAKVNALVQQGAKVQRIYDNLPKDVISSRRLCPTPVYQKKSTLRERGGIKCKRRSIY